MVFREADAFDLRSWFRHLFRDKEPRPNAGAALFCFALMISLAWFSMQSGAMGSPLKSMVLGHLVFILGPPVDFSVLADVRPDGHPPAPSRRRWSDLALAAGLAMGLNPIVREVAFHVEKLFPASSAIQSQLAEMTGQIPNLGVALLVFALLPAISEELAFRGFILSGLDKSYETGTAVVLSALLFGFLHVLLSLFQQLFGSTLLGLVIGLIAIRSGSLWPGRPVPPDQQQPRAC